ncbi:hypothetical protein CDD83_9590 [Cordyceps sp. RAO-2017]|nr:hypothetical protein CDD83_9590 [Cordyceps sp. RAO-2017]
MPCHRPARHIGQTTGPGIREGGGLRVWPHKPALVFTCHQVADLERGRLVSIAPWVRGSIGVSFVLAFPFGSPAVAFGSSSFSSLGPGSEGPSRSPLSSPLLLRFLLLRFFFLRSRLFSVFFSSSSAPAGLRLRGRTAGKPML